MSKPPALSGSLLECYKLLKKVMNHQYAWPFNQPVDPIALGIPNYFDVIKEPMDLGTIQKNLEEDKYSSPEEVDAHVNLVWKNAKTFNPPNHDVFKMADTLSKIWSRGFPKVRNEKTTTPKKGKSKENTPVKALKEDSTTQFTNTIYQLKESMNNVKEEIAKYRQSPKSPPSTTTAASKKRNLPSKSKNLNKEMTFEEKTQLSNNISSLESDQLDQLLKIIQKAIPSLEGSTENTIEIELDKLDTTTLRECERYVKSCLTKNKKKHSKSTIEKDKDENESGTSSSDHESGGETPSKKPKLENPTPNLPSSLSTTDQDLRVQVGRLEALVRELRAENEQLKKELDEEKNQKKSLRKKVELMEKALKD